MINKLRNLWQRVKSSLVAEQFRPAGTFSVDCYDSNGLLKWSQEFKNGIVDEGIEYLLDAGFNGGSQVSTWYMGLVDNSGFSAFANGDTMASHSGWTESTDYSESNRPEWTAGAAASRAVTNSSTVDFSMNATATIHGIFITSNNTKSGTTGTLWSTAAFSSNASVTNGDTLKVTYTVSG